MIFFLEYFLYANQFLGRLPTLPFETPGSLTDKIYSQLKYNHPDRQSEYLASYIQALMRNFGNLINAAQDPYKSLLSEFFEPFLREEAAQDKKRRARQRQLIQDNLQRFLDLLEKFKEAYDFDNIEGHVDALYQLIGCNDPVHDHYDAIAQRAQLLVAAFRFMEVPKGAIDGYVDRILSRDQNNFPLPGHILKEKQNKDVFDKLAKDFLQNRGFKEQLEGFKNLIHITQFQKGFFVYRLEGIDMQQKHLEQLDATFGQVRILGAQHKVLSKVKSNALKLKEKQDYGDAYDYFFDKTAILAIVELDYDRPKIAEIHAQRLIEEATVEFNNYIGHQINMNRYNRLLVPNLMIEGFEHSRSLPPGFEVDDQDIANVNQNAYTQLHGTTSETADLLRRNERIFGAAWRTKDPAGFWQYLENLLWDQNLKDTHVKAPFTQLCISGNKRIWEELMGYFGRMFRMEDDQFLKAHTNVTNELSKELDEELFIKMDKNYDFNELYRTTNSRFLKKLIDEIWLLDSPAAESIWKTFFNELINELKDYRNASLHAGKVNLYSGVKMPNVIRPIINDVRWYIIYKCKDHPHDSPPEFWKKLLTVSRLLFLLPGLYHLLIW